ncbi:MAG: hypothetical protein K2M69_07845 [Muribaculaceae bacterium]|nr:hypothetical protein [Muribaculaceae bacterium]
MDRAEALMESAPDSAMTILDSITLGALSSERDKARHALLRSMALDKTFVDTITFDVLQPAIDCYLEKGTPDEKLRTLYYQGRIYQNRKEDEEAMKCFIKASELKNEITDSIVLGRTFFAMSGLYMLQGRIEKYIHNALLAADIYAGSDRMDLSLFGLLNAKDGYILLEDKEKADSIVGVLNTFGHIDDPYYSFRHNQIIYGVEFFSTTDLRNLLDSLQHLSSDDNIRLDMARGYTEAGLEKKDCPILIQFRSVTEGAY